MLSERRMLSLKTNHPNITKKAKKVKNSNSGCVAVALDRKRILFVLQ